MANINADKYSLFIVWWSSTTSNAYFYFSSQRATESSTPGLLNTRVISSDSLYIGVNNHIIVRVSKTVQNITLTLTSAAITEHRRRQSCLPAIHQQYFNQSLQAGESSCLYWVAGHVKKSPTMHCSGFPRHTQSMVRVSLSHPGNSDLGLWVCCKHVPCSLL